MEQQYFPTICVFLCILREFSVITNYFSGLDGRRLLAISCFVCSVMGEGSGVSSRFRCHAELHHTQISVTAKIIFLYA